MTAASENSAFTPWLPAEQLRELSVEEAQYSRGFLRSEPERWFPGFGNRWLPLVHALGSEVRIVSARPSVEIPELAFGFMGSIDDEPFAIACSNEHARALVEIVSPGCRQVAGEVILEYLFQRLTATAAATWIGDDQTVLRLEPELSFRDYRPVAGIELQLSLNELPCSFWILIGKIFCSKLDGLWRRQFRSTRKLDPDDGESLSLELAQLAVPTQDLPNYLKPDTLIDLEVPVGSSASVFLGERRWLSAELVQSSGKLGFQVLSTNPSSEDIPDGSTQISVQFPVNSPGLERLSELPQAGACFVSDLLPGDEVKLFIHSEEVGRAVLGVYQGRLAIRVL